MSEFTRLQVDGRVFYLSLHALRRLADRGVAIDEVSTALLEGERFRYFHDGSWKDGYHHQESRILVTVANDTITTVITNVRPSYIDSLKAGTP